MSTASFPEASLAKWRALVEKDLAGKPFDKTLEQEAFPGVTIAPLYTEAPPLDDAARRSLRESFAICTWHDADAEVAGMIEDVVGGADALWLPFDRHDELTRGELARTTFVLEATEVPLPKLAATVTERAIFGVDPIAWRARGRAPFASLADDLVALGELAASRRSSPTVVVSTEPYHDAGADAADEIAFALSTGATYLEALFDAGLAPDEAATSITLRTAVGRDTFVELCKLRALRICWSKMLAACDTTSDHLAQLHAVGSTQTLTVRDPWVNMLRGTTQVFAAVTGGADLVTPRTFDHAFGASSALGRRVARNTGLVLREESALAKVRDPAGGSYYFDTLTDTIARAAWARFRDLSRDGGVVKALERGDLSRRLEASWRARFDRIAKRKVPILGVSEFANLDEKLPHAPPATPHDASGPIGLPVHREAAEFEELRVRAESMASPPELPLFTIGTFAESRPRAGFATNFFAAGGIRTREISNVEETLVVCLCGTDAAYAEEAADRVAALKGAGVKRVLLAGRPGALEAQLRAAGVDGFVFVGCDVVATLSDVLSTFVEAER